MQSDLASWQAAEAASGPRLAEAAAGLARLDERLALGMGEGGLALLGAGEAVALARAGGARVSLDGLMLWRHGAVGGGADPAGLRAAGWALRRLTGPAGETAALATPGGLGRFLADGEDEDKDPRDDPAPPRPGLAELAGALAALAPLHPLTRAAAAWALWRAAMGREAAVEGRVLVARLGAAGQGAARFLPLGPLAPARRPGAEAALTALLDAAIPALGAARGLLARRADWRRAAEAEAASLPGRLAIAVVAQLAEAPLLSANALRDRLGITQQAANATLARLAALGLVEEVSGQARYRVWRARA